MCPNKPFPSIPGPLYQNEVKYSAFDKEIFTRKVDCALGLILKVTVFGTRKWPVRCKTCSEQTPLTKKKKKNISKRHSMKVNASVVKQPLETLERLSCQLGST